MFQYHNQMLDLHSFPLQICGHRHALGLRNHTLSHPGIHPNILHHLVLLSFPTRFLHHHANLLHMLFHPHTFVTRSLLSCSPSIHLHNVRQMTTSLCLGHVSALHAIAPHNTHYYHTFDPSRGDTRVSAKLASIDQCRPLRFGMSPAVE